MPGDSSNRIAAEVNLRLAITQACRLGEILGELGNIANPFPERRHHHPDHAQAVIKIGTELSVAHHLLQVAAGCRNEVDIHGFLADPAERPDLAIFDDFQQLGLGAQIEFADFIQKQGAAVGRLDQAELALLGVGKRPALVTEQLRLEQGCGNSGAVDFNKRPRFAAPFVVQRTGNQFFAGAGFPGDQHRGRLGAGHAKVGVNDAADHGFESHHHFGFTDDFGKDGGARLHCACHAGLHRFQHQLSAPRGLLRNISVSRAAAQHGIHDFSHAGFTYGARPFFKAAARQHPFDDHSQRRQLHRLSEVIGCACFQRIDSNLLAAGAGQHDDPRARGLLHDFLQHLDAVDARQVVVQDDQLRGNLFQALQADFSAGG